MFRIGAAKHMDRVVDVLDISKSSQPTNKLKFPGLGPKAVDIRQKNARNMWNIIPDDEIGREKPNDESGIRIRTRIPVDQFRR